MASKDILKHNGNVVPEINDEENSQFGAYEVYSRDKVRELLREVQLNSGYDWSGRVLTFEGESLTGNAVMGYPNYVAEKTGSTAVNIGISGKMIYPDAAGNIEDFRRRVSNIPADTDAIIIMGDCNSNILQDATQAYSTDPAEWGGRWNIALDAVKKSFPTVPVFLVFEWVGDMNSKQIKNGPEAFWRFANNHGCIFVNLRTESPLNLQYASQVWGLNANDKVHTNHEAMPLFADVIIRHLKQIPPFEWKGWDTISIAESSVTVQAGKTVNLTVTKTGDLSTQWTSSNMDVACVLGGVVYGMSAGTATITAKTRNGNTATCTVTVTEATT